jgi:hypothetical protein
MYVDTGVFVGCMCTLQAIQLNLMQFLLLSIQARCSLEQCSYEINIHAYSCTVNHKSILYTCAIHTRTECKCSCDTNIHACSCAVTHTNTTYICAMHTQQSASVAMTLTSMLLRCCSYHHKRLYTQQTECK